RFSAAACLTMLHHIPSAELQDAALAELARVLRPGGVLVGTDGLDTPERRRVHIGDVFVPVDPETLQERLHRAGFADARVEVGADRLRFAATSAARPAADTPVSRQPRSHRCRAGHRLPYRSLSQGSAQWPVGVPRAR